MAAKTATRKPVVVKTREEEAATVVNSTSTAEAAARELAVSFASETMSRDERLFEQARIAFAAIATGAKPNDIAKATTTAMAETFPTDAREWAAETSVSNGGAKVSRVTIVQRADAYSAILSAGITVPTVELVSIAFRAFTSKGAPGLADGHKRLIADTLKVAEAGRVDFYRANARSRANEIVARKKAANAPANSEAAATRSADKKAERPAIPADVTFTGSAAEFVDVIKAGLSLPWSDDDRAEIMAALTEIVGA